MRPIQPLVRLPDSYIDPNWLSADPSTYPRRISVRTTRATAFNLGPHLWRASSSAPLLRYFSRATMRYQSLHKGTLHPTEHSLPHAIDLLVLTHILNTKHPIKGKCLECDVEDGFAVQASLTGSLVGHIALGTLIVSTTLLEITQADKTLLAGRSFEEVRAHILHVILAHHGTNEHGSPVEPQTLEALIVHSLDTLDAHAEIMRAAPNANLIDAPRPLKGKLARSLKRSAADG